MKPILSLLDEVDVKGIAHITGGGFYENLPRMLPGGLGIDIPEITWTIPSIFDRAI